MKCLPNDCKDLFLYRIEESIKLSLDATKDLTYKAINFCIIYNKRL